MYSGWLSPLQVRHGDSCIAAEAARTARRCEPLSRYVDAVAPYLEQHGVRTVFLATDSEEAPHIYMHIYICISRRRVHRCNKCV